MKVKFNDQIILVGTAHISKDSVEEVKKTIEEENPDVVGIELCKQRYKALTEKKKWENTPVSDLLKSNKAYLMLAQTFLASIQRKLGKEYGVEPGSEMIEALKQAKEHDKEVALVDRDITITFKRAWRKMGFREKFRVSWEFLKALIGYDEEEMEEIDLEEMMKQDFITEMMEEFSKIAPSISEVLISERDEYIARKILDQTSKGKKIVAVVGAGHLNGIKKHLEKNKYENDISTLETVPKKRINLLKTIGYAIPVVFAGLILYAFFYKGTDLALEMFLYWFLINGICSAIGTALARGHPLSILTAFGAAPLTSLNPAVAAGWVAGYVEAKLRKPMVKDFQELSKLESLKDFWRNRVIRLLLVVAFANVGSTIGTVVAFPYITSLLA